MRIRGRKERHREKRKERRRRVLGGEKGLIMKRKSYTDVANENETGT